LVPQANVALLDPRLDQRVEARCQARLFKGDRNVVTPVVTAVPGDSDFVLAMEDDVVGMRVLVLVVVRLERDGRLDGERFQFAGEAVFRLGEFADD